MSGIRKGLILLAAVCLCVLCVDSLAYAAEEEKETARVGVFELNGFYEYDEFGELSGYGIDYLKAIAAQGGFPYELVETDSWESALKLLEEGKIDMLAPAQLTAERSEQFLYDAFPIGTEYGALLALSTNAHLIYEDFEAFGEMKIGCVSTIVFMDSFQAYAQEHEFTPDLVYYKDTAALKAALQAGEVDAILANLMVKTDTMKVLGKFGAAPIYYLMNPNRPELAEAVNKSIRELSALYPNYMNELTERYFPYYVHTPFTKAELAYIEAMEPLRVGLPAEFAPVSYRNENGEAAGIDRYILERISELSGLEFEYLMLPTDRVPYDYLRENQVSLVANVEYNSLNVNAPGIRMTTPYLTMSKVFVGKDSVTYDLEEPLKLAVASASQILYEVLAVEYPNFEVVQFETTEQCFDAVLSGEADLILQNRYVVEPFLQSPRYEKLKVLPTEAIESKFCFSIVINQQGTGVSDEILSDPMLISILNKSIALISDAELDKYMSFSVADSGYQYTARDFFYQYRVPAGIVTVVLIAGAAALTHAYLASRKSGRIVRDSERKLRNITNNINGGVVVLRAEEGMEITYANDGFLELVQCTREEFENLYGSSYMACVHEDDLPTIDFLIQEDVEEGERISVQLRIKRKDGEYIRAMFNGTMSRKEDGQKELYCVIMDVSIQAELQEKLAIEKKRTDIILEKADEIIYEVDLLKKEIYVSRSLQEKFGWTFPNKINREDLKQKLTMWRMVEEDRGILEERTLEILQHHADVHCNVRLLKDRTVPVWCEIAQYPVLNDDGRLVSVVGRILDVDAKVKEKMRLEAKSQRDSLTGLYNKETFAKEVKKYLKKEQGGSSALLFIDLDHFKNVNDTLGHMMGDKAIRDAAKKLQVIFSNYDILSRFGGDEFCVFVKDIPKDTLRHKLEWLVEKLQETYERDGKSAHISGSVGVAYTEIVGTDYDRMAECADQALYKSKEKGRNGYTIYNEEQ